MKKNVIFSISFLAIMLYSCKSREPDQSKKNGMHRTEDKSLLRFKNYDKGFINIDFSKMAETTHDLSNLNFDLIKEEERNVILRIMDDLHQVDFSSSFFNKNPPKISFLKLEKHYSEQFSILVFNKVWSVDSSVGCDENYYFVLHDTSCVSAFIADSKCYDEGFVKEVLLKKSLDGSFYLESKFDVIHDPSITPKIVFQKFKIDDHGISLL